MKYKKLKYAWNWPYQLELILISHAVFKFSQLNAYKNGKSQKKKSTHQVSKIVARCNDVKMVFPQIFIVVHKAERSAFDDGYFIFDRKGLITEYFLWKLCHFIISLIGWYRRNIVDRFRFTSVRVTFFIQRLTSFRDTSFQLGCFSFYYAMDSYCKD